MNSKNKTVWLFNEVRSQTLLWTVHYSMSQVGTKQNLQPFYHRGGGTTNLNKCNMISSNIVSQESVALPKILYTRLVKN